MAINLQRLIAVGCGQKPADMVLRNARIVNVFNGKIEKGNVAIAGGVIAGVGDYDKAKDVIDLENQYLLPGFINGHVHIESSMLDVPEYARAVVPRGTTALVTDLHEIANVAGLDGIEYVLQRAAKLPFDLYLMAPSCVPATHMETSGAELGTTEIKQLLRLKQCLGIGEMMNFPGVLFGVKDVLNKLTAAQKKAVDGHAPGLSGKDLNAYLAAGIGSDHESVTVKEGREKLGRGMYLMIREGSSEKNLETLLPLVNNKTYPRCMLVVDDRSAADILNDGDIDAVVRKAIKLGMNPVRAIRLATINTANYFRMARHGAIAPGYYANLIVSRDLKTVPIDAVFHHGIIVGKNRQPLFPVKNESNTKITDSMKVKPFKIESLRLKPRGASFPTIEIVPGQIITRRLDIEPKVVDGFVETDVPRDILKLAVVERHKKSGNIGIGLVKGFGLKLGAIASSVAHDSHNIVCAGTNDADIYLAVQEIIKAGGGLAVVAAGKVLASLTLPVAGLLSDQPLEQVVRQQQRVDEAAAKLGCNLPAPFATLSFLALPVIPELRLTDMGLVDVAQFKLI
ncbi:MAG TPA: adenine deaminase [Dehalococcoidales bacterium]|nr:adenine deaminase [Dehalococcoidales bacterium]